MYADVLREYGVDLRGLFTTPAEITPKLALALVEHLPSSSSSSATLREVPDSHGWDTNSYLISTLINAVRDNTYVNMQVRTKKKLKPFPPVEVPGVSNKKKKKPVSGFVRMAQAMRAQAQTQGE